MLGLREILFPGQITAVFTSKGKRLRSMKKLRKNHTVAKTALVLRELPFREPNQKLFLDGSNSYETPTSTQNPSLL